MNILAKLFGSHNQDDDQNPTKKEAEEIDEIANDPEFDEWDEAGQIPHTPEIGNVPITPEPEGDDGGNSDPSRPWWKFW